MTDLPGTVPDTETLVEQLANPVFVLVNALQRVYEADVLQSDLRNLHPATSQYQELIAYRDHLDATADTLAFIAKTAGELVEAARHTQQVFDGPEVADEPLHAVPVRESAPQPVRGVRFTADLRGQRVGVVAGRDWLHVPGHGFLDITEADEFADGASLTFVLSGRIVSGTSDHILGILGNGTSITLPRALVTESPDE